MIENVFVIDDDSYFGGEFEERTYFCRSGGWLYGCAFHVFRGSLVIWARSHL